jgi:hypothetical protein
MMLAISALLGIIPLLGVGWIATHDDLLTVDALFMSLILLAISGMFFLNVALEAQALRKRKGQPSGASAGAKGKTITVVAAGGSASGEAVVRRGIVERVEFFEAPIGKPDKSIVTLRDGKTVHTLVLDEDLRNALPVGKRVEIVYRTHGDHNDVMDLNYLSVPFGKAA